MVSILRTAGLLFLAAVMLQSCGNRGGVKEVTETRTVEAPAPTAPEGAGSAERFGFDQQTPASSPHAQASMYAWDVPAGWQEKPKTQLRLANFQVGPKGEAECYLTVLPGTAGGVVANVNRWRRDQMGLPESTEEEIRRLPTIPMLGGQAVYVEIAGAYAGMGGEAPKPGFKLLGADLEGEDRSVFVKMIGPASVVEQERENFKAFCRSLHPAAHAPPAPEMPASGASEVPRPGS